jgi:hypothetical protein
VLILVLAVVALLLEAQRGWLKLPMWMPADLVMTLIGFGAFLGAFGYVSRRFERQADVFAARTLQRTTGETGWFAAMANPDDPSTTFTAQGLAKVPPAAGKGEAAIEVRSFVGPYGAALFASALERVAVINHMPLGPRGRFEGSLTRRLGFVMELIGDAANNWLHGSITQRMRTLQSMSSDPAHTRRFDRRMSRLYVTLLVALVVSGTLAWVVKVPI